MNPLIQLKAKLQCFAKALLNRTKGNTLGEISKLIFCALLLTLVLRSGPACSGFTWGGWPGVGTPSPSPEAVPQARSVQFFNCNKDNAGTGLSARAYNVYSRVDDGAWVEQGELNPQPGDWTNCHDEPHTGASLNLEIVDQPGKWEFWVIKRPREGEQDCNSAGPPDQVQNLCDHLTYIFQTVVEHVPDPVQVDVTE
jgi:hypothetical protein